MCLLLIHTTLDDQARANELAQQLIEQRLAACATVGAAVTAHYIWQGKVETTCEYPLTIKTTSARIAAVKDFLRAHHPYELPEIWTQEINDVDPAYWQWVQQQTR